MANGYPHSRSFDPIPFHAAPGESGLSGWTSQVPSATSDHWPEGSSLWQAPTRESPVETVGFGWCNSCEGGFCSIGNSRYPSLHEERSIWCREIERKPSLFGGIGEAQGVLLASRLQLEPPWYYTLTLDKLIPSLHLVANSQNARQFWSPEWHSVRHPGSLPLSHRQRF